MSISEDRAVLERDDLPLGRNRFLALLGASLFGAATSLVRGNRAWAGHEPAVKPCAGYGRCHCCNGTNCCWDRCYATHPWHSHGCPGGSNCWYACGGADGNQLYQCCDWHYTNGEICICRSADLGRCN